MIKTNNIYIGTNYNNSYFQHIHFYVSDDEVRPKNTAVKIWKRIQ